MKTLLAALLTFLFVVSSVSAQGNDPVAVIDGYIAAENARNVDAALAFFADDAVINETSLEGFPELTHTGKGPIRAYLQRLVDGYVTVEKVTEPVLVGDKVEWTEIISESALVETRRVEAQVQDGKIKSIQVVDVLRASGRTVPWTGAPSPLVGMLLLAVLGLSTFGVGMLLFWRVNVNRLHALAVNSERRRLMDSTKERK